MSDTIASAVADLRDISLEDLASGSEAVEDVLRRVIPVQPDSRVAVARFNSSI